MRFLLNLINKFFLVKEIRSQEGELHFLRWRLFDLFWFRIYIHKICLPDYDAHKHDHPWHFLSLILKGGYYEEWSEASDQYYLTKATWRSRWSLIHHLRSDTHSIKRVHGPVWTLVLGFGKYQKWGYRIWDEKTNSDSKWVEATVYRKMKREMNL